MTIKHQKIEKRKDLDNGNVLVVTIRHDDECGNGHETFSITADLYEPYRQPHEPSLRHAKTGRKIWLNACGCLHDEVREHFPELRRYLQWHLTSTDGPMHYIANSEYWHKEKNWEYARSSCVFGVAPSYDHTDVKDINAGEFQQFLIDRLPELMSEFQKAVESLGLKYTDTVTA